MGHPFRQWRACGWPQLGGARRFELARPALFRELNDGHDHPP